MKVVVPKYNHHGSGKETLLPLIPKEAPLNKENSVTIELRTNPADANSAKLKITMRVLRGDEDLRSMVQWYEDLTSKVMVGLNLTTGLAQRNMVRNLMEGHPRSLFDQICEALAGERRLAAVTVANPDTGHADHLAVLAEPLDGHVSTLTVAETIQHVLQSIMPLKALERVKRYLRRDCRKPADMKIRYYYQLLLRINTQEIPRLPPFNANMRFSDDELMDIILFGIPKSWHREMDRQGIDPIALPLAELVQFFEQIEAAEEHESHAKQVSKDHKKSRGKRDSGPSDNNKYCLIHGHGGHSSDECHKLKAEAKRLKSNNHHDQGKGKSSNKTWKREADDGRKKSQKELNAFVKKSIKDGVKKGLNAMSKDKKRKISVEEELNLVDMQLKEFNYSDMENLKIDSDDDGISV